MAVSKIGIPLTSSRQSERKGQQWQQSRGRGTKFIHAFNALARPWPKGEMIIAETIGVDPKEIWPSRYFDGKTGTKINRNLRGK